MFAVRNQVHLVPMSFAISGKIVNSSFFDSVDGLIAITVINGIAPFSYLWNTGATTDTVTVKAGIYTVTVTDGVNETVTETYTVSQPLNFQVQLQPFDTGLLSDQISRDIYCRKLIGSGAQFIATGQAVIGLYLKGTTTTFSAVGTIQGQTETDKSGGMLLSVYDGITPYGVLHLTKGGVQINGNLTITGTQTELVTNNVIVNDKTITLNAHSQSSSDNDGSGMIIGQGSSATHLLYASAHDTMAFNSGLQLTSPNASLRFGSDWTGATSILSASQFKVDVNGNAIELDANGLTITNCRLVNPVPITQQIAADVGLLNRPNGAYFGYDSLNNYWSTSGHAIHASSFTTGTASFSNTGFSLPFSSQSAYNATAVANNTVSMSPTGFNVNNSVIVSKDGLDLDNFTSAIYFGNRNWKIVYNADENAIEFQKLTNGVFVSKLVLD